MSVTSRFFKYIVSTVLILVMAVGMASCSSSKHTAKSSSYPKSSSHKAPARKTTESKMKHIDFSEVDSKSAASKLLHEADTWIGIPYKWAGNDRDGVDCSGFVLQVYLRSLNISLPRTSAQQQEYCKAISKKDLRPGDLVFFTVRGGKRVGHVGIYIGDGNMIHSSSSKGVVITPLDNPYFVTNYHSSGRVERLYSQKSKNEKVKAKKEQKKKSEPKKDAEKTLKKVNEEKRTVTTPMPSDVFGAPTKKEEPTPQPNPTNDEPEPEPDFFD